MAMLLVLLLIVLVTAAGVFAAYSASIEVRSAGYVRQAAQTHYVAQSGVVASLDELRRHCGDVYVPLMRQRQAAAVTPAGLYVASAQMDFVEAMLDRLTTPGNVFASPSPFGVGRLAPDFRTTVTQLYEVQLIGAGQDVNGHVLRAYAFELSSTGATRLLNVNDPQQRTAGEEQARVIANVPCI